MFLAHNFFFFGGERTPLSSGPAL